MMENDAVFRVFYFLMLQNQLKLRKTNRLYSYFAIYFQKVSVFYEFIVVKFSYFKSIKKCNKNRTV